MLIDAFPFFNELEMLRTRLEYLGDHIDQFIVLESTIDFSGRSKPLILTPGLLETLPHAQKIKVHVWQPDHFSRIFLFPFARLIKWRKILWRIQNLQRDSLLDATRHLIGKDVIIFGDLDEFIDRNELDQAHHVAESDQVYSVSQHMYYYNLLTKHKDLWSGTAVCNLSVMRLLKPSRIRHKRLDHEKKFNGWHFSYFADAKRIQQKISIISGAENLTAFENISVDQINIQMKQGADLYARKEIHLLRLTESDIPKELFALISNQFKNL